MAKSIYTRLTGRKRTLIGYSQLWLAPDHLLLVQSTRFSERYQRFSLADIQAVIVTELPEQMAYQFVVLAAVIGCVAGFLSVSAMFGKIVFAAMAAIALGIMIGNIALGPRCRCHLQTAVSYERLAPVRRVRAARVFLQKIIPVIETVQGTLAPDRAAQIEFPATPVEKPPAVPDAPGYLPEILCAVFLLNAALIAASVRFPRAQLSSVLFTTIFGEIVVLIVSLARSRHDKRRFVYALMIPAIFCIVWDAVQLGTSFFTWMNGIAESAKRGEQTPPSMLAWVAFSQTQALFAASWRVAVAALGLAAAWFER
ncbi:MAG: hypothetical protein LAO79_03560 [Acidobacteriia bacterium]|nr:hypothetical protein [Terriglobia bacterium]